MSSLVNVRSAFSYTLLTSSVSYLRNYNFNSATVTDLRMGLVNRDETVPITVNISASVPWIRIKNDENIDITFPTGNVVLAPSSSQEVFLTIDLPPELEEEDNIFYPDIHIKVESGSKPIGEAPSSPAERDAIVLSQATLTLGVNQSIKITAAVFDQFGIRQVFPRLEWQSEDTLVARVLSVGQVETQFIPGLDDDSAKYIRGVSVGATNIIVTDGTRTTLLPVTVVGASSGG